MPEDERNDCPAYQIPDCAFRMKDIEAVEAVITSVNCAETWSCPFWVSPIKGNGDGGDDWRPDQVLV